MAYIKIAINRFERGYVLQFLEQRDIDSTGKILCHNGVNVHRGSYPSLDSANLYIRGVDSETAQLKLLPRYVFEKQGQADDEIDKVIEALKATVTKLNDKAVQYDTWKDLENLHEVHEFA